MTWDVIRLVLTEFFVQMMMHWDIVYVKMVVMLLLQLLVDGR